MAIDLQHISEKIFKIMKANGLNLILFTEGGEVTLDPAMARRFYSKNKNIMVNLETTDQKNILKVGVGKSVDIQDMKRLFDSLRTLSTQHALSYVLRTFGKDISPKDFAYQSIAESFSRPYGTIKTSRQKYENATLYIKHRKAVNEEIRGSRSRYIHSIFIENNNGERFKFPFKNLLSARAMTVHVNEGGTPYDLTGKYIISLAEESNELKKFKSLKKKECDINENVSLFVKESISRIKDINKILKKMNGKQGYNDLINKGIKEEQYYLDLLEDYDFAIDDDSMKPYLSKIAHKLKEDKNKANNILSLIKEIIDKGELELSPRPMSQTNPANLAFDDEKSKMSALFGHYAELVNDNVMSDKLRQISDDIYIFDEKYVELANKLLTVLKKFAKVSEQSGNQPKAGILEMHIREIEKNFDSFIGIYK